MAINRKIEVFATGCSSCDGVVSMVQEIACPSCEVEVVDIRKVEGARRAEELGIRSAPAVAIDGRLAGCCTTDGSVSKETLRAEGVGQPA